MKKMNRKMFMMVGLGTLLSTKIASAETAVPASPVPTDEALIDIGLPVSSLPPSPLAVGAVLVTMAPGTTIVYPEGAAGRSVAIDHVLEGGYEVESGGELMQIDVDGKRTDIKAQESTTLTAGQTVVFLQNEAQQRITVGKNETRTLTVGFFSLQQGTNESMVDGTLEQKILGGTVLQTLPDTGVTVTVVPANQANSLTDAIAKFPVTVDSGESWVVVVVPLVDKATPSA